MVDPTPTIVTVVPETVATFSSELVYVTVSPDGIAVAVSVKGKSPYVTSARGSKVIV
ncbi:hypothetical protein D3C87_1028170 [compost metagenome]